MATSLDIVERLRDWPRMTPVACKEAADEIERLRQLLRSEGANRYWEGRWRDADAEIERLRAALQEIADMRYDNTSAATIAQRALETR